MQCVAGFFLDWWLCCTAIEVLVKILWEVPQSMGNAFPCRQYWHIRSKVGVRNFGSSVLL